jgi:5-aminolevulinate synthase
MEYRRFFDDAISKLKGERRYRVFADLARNAEAYPRAAWRREAGRAPVDVTVWCSNDYLGMGRHPKVIAAMTAAAAAHGVGSGGTRNISGNNHPIVEMAARFEIQPEVKTRPACLPCRSASSASSSTIG